MVILQIEPATGFSGGVNQMILNSVELKRRGHTVYVACVRNSVVHERLKDVVDRFLFVDEERTLYSARLIRRFLSGSNVDIVHTHHSRGHTMGLLALLGRTRERLVVQRSVMFPATNPFKYLNPRVNRFVANSEAVKDVLIRHMVRPGKISVIYSAIDPDLLPDDDKETLRRRFGFGNRFVFGVVANYSRYKGQELLLEAFSRIKNRENALLVFAGRSTEKLHPLVERAGLKENVRILGFRSDSASVIKALDCLVIPSLKESFPNVAIEAFFMKTPVLGTQVGGIPELLRDGRGYTAEPSAKSLSGAMILVYNAPDRDQTANRAYRFAMENLTIQRKVDRLEELYTRLLGK